jgi:hypothetical protein
MSNASELSNLAWHALPLAHIVRVAALAPAQWAVVVAFRALPLALASYRSDATSRT